MSRSQRSAVKSAFSRLALAVAALMGVVVLAQAPAAAREIGPGTDLCGEIRAMQPGGELVLAPGDYQGPCAIRNGGEPGAPLLIRAADPMRRPRIVYAGRGDTGLFIADATGQDPPRPVRIATGGNLEPGIGVAEAQWSPDGSLIAFRGGGHVFVVRPDGTDLHRIADGYVYGLAWSPDSLSLAFAGPVGPATFGNVTVVGRDGTTHRRIAHCTCTLRGPGFSPSIAWSSDGSRLTYVGERGNVVGTVRANGLDATPVLAGNWDPSWPLWRPGHHA